mmetsp:Transcript_4647/g.12011  ORF Transcript_4647/g.12011 Transcript_4647/m.12011 type:complete len:154 (+) Transcript_4647:210-671(+)
MRFFWKPAEKVKAKILRQVNFPLNLDVYDLCEDELKERLKPARAALKEKEDKAVAEAATKAIVDESKMEVSAAEPAPLEEGLSGMYELVAVLTHRGRAADSGHYVGWVKEKGDRWIKFDDDKVSFCVSEDVKKLSGGGDWHTAYICLYRTKNP